MSHRWAAGLFFLSTGAGCLITTDPEFSPPPGEFVNGAMMCSVCWNRAFCLSPDTGEFIEADGAESCPDGFIFSEQASRITSSVDRLNDFFCIVPDGKTVGAPPITPGNPNGVLCDSAPDRAVHEFLDTAKMYRFPVVRHRSSTRKI